MSELQVVVEKAFGGSKFSVKTEDGQNLICHIPGRFKKGQKKQQNFVKVGQVILVETRNGDMCDFIKIISQTSVKKDDSDFSLVSPQSQPPELEINISMQEEDINFDDI